jgi:poly(3-hydroxybutyrate) depolymerase
MADILGREYPDVFAAVGVHSGLPQGAAHDVASAFAVMRNGVASSGPVAAAMPFPREPARARREGASAGASATASRAARTIVFHGDADPTVHPSNGNQVLDAALQRAGSETVQTTTVKSAAAGRAYTRTVHRRSGAAPAEASLAEQWVIHGAGHAWSGGSSKGSYADANGPDASREMVRFFEEQPLPEQ